MKNFKHFFFFFFKKEYTEPLGTSSRSFSKIPKNHAPCSPAHFSDPSCLKAKPRPLKDFWGFVYLTAFGCAHLWRSEVNCGVNSPLPPRWNSSRKAWSSTCPHLLQGWHHGVARALTCRVSLSPGHTPQQSPLW